MLNPQRTLKLISGGLFDPEKTWGEYLPEAGDWQKTAFLLTGPLIILAAVAAYVFGFLGSDVSIFGRFRPTLVSTLFSILFGVVAAGAFAYVVSVMAGVFGGTKNFALGLAATSFAFIPGYLGQAVTWLPWIGGLLGFGLFIYGMVLLWKIIPAYLAVPKDRRVGHYIMSLVISVAVMFVFMMTVGRVLYPSMAGPSFSDGSDGLGFGSSGGLYGGVARQAELIAAAEDDRYDPPSSGRLSEKQVREFLRVMQRTEIIEQEKMARLEEISKKAERDENISFQDLGSMMSGMTEVAGLRTAEIEVVKSADGNWAEHQWVREALHSAWLQKDINDAIKHNYDLYQQFEGDLSKFIVR